MLDALLELCTATIVSADQRLQNHCTRLLEPACQAYSLIFTAIEQRVLPFDLMRTPPPTNIGFRAGVSSERIFQNQRLPVVVLSSLLSFPADFTRPFLHGFLVYFRSRGFELRAVLSRIGRCVCRFRARAVPDFACFAGPTFHRGFPLSPAR